MVTNVTLQTHPPATVPFLAWYRTQAKQIRIELFSTVIFIWEADFKILKSLHFFFFLSEREITKQTIRGVNLQLEKGAELTKVFLEVSITVTFFFISFSIQL